MAKVKYSALDVEGIHALEARIERLSRKEVREGLLALTPRFPLDEVSENAAVDLLTRPGSGTNRWLLLELLLNSKAVRPTPRILLSVADLWDGLGTALLGIVASPHFSKSPKAQFDTKARDRRGALSSWLGAQQRATEVGSAAIGSLMHLIPEQMLGLPLAAEVTARAQIELAATSHPASSLREVPYGREVCASVAHWAAFETSKQQEDIGLEEARARVDLVHHTSRVFSLRACLASRMAHAGSPDGIGANAMFAWAQLTVSTWIDDVYSHAWLAGLSDAALTALVEAAFKAGPDRPAAQVSWRELKGRLLRPEPGRNPALPCRGVAEALDSALDLLPRTAIHPSTAGSTNGPTGIELPKVDPLEGQLASLVELEARAVSARRAARLTLATQYENIATLISQEMQQRSSVIEGLMPHLDSAIDALRSEAALLRVERPAADRRDEDDLWETAPQEPKRSVAELLESLRFAPSRSEEVTASLRQLASGAIAWIALREPDTVRSVLGGLSELPPEALPLLWIGAIRTRNASLLSEATTGLGAGGAWKDSAWLTVLRGAASRGFWLTLEGDVRERTLDLLRRAEAEANEQLEAAPRAAIQPGMLRTLSHSAGTLEDAIAPVSRVITLLKEAMNDRPRH